MAVTVYSFSHRTSALNALKSVESFFERNNLDYELVQLKDSSSLPVSVPTMRAICELRILRQPFSRIHAVCQLTIGRLMMSLQVQTSH